MPVEASRQQSLLLREPELAQQHMLQAAANEQALNLSRPMPTTETEGTIVDPDAEGTPERGTGSRARNRHSKGERQEAERRSGGDGVSGTRIDLTV